MVPNCYGCEFEFEDAYLNQEKYGLHLATSPNYPMSENVASKGHFGMILVNDKGEIVIW